MQATFGTLVGYLGVADRSAVKAACPLEGGGASEGSTCGVVSGGCLALVPAHLVDILPGEEGKGEALYRRMRAYTGWFEDEFGSDLCRERCGVDIKELSGFMNYLFTGKVVTRCVSHIGRAVEKLIGLINQPLEKAEEVTDLDRHLAEVGGYCASEVMRGIREEVGWGNLYLERISLAFDGGVGLSGGLCGALAGALMLLGLVWGIDPKEEGLTGTLAAFTRGHVNLYTGRREPELWAVANPLVREFKREYGSLECADLTDRSFATGGELADHMAGSTTCAGVKEWCRARTVELIRSYAT